MPFQYQETTTPAGGSLLRVHASGRVALEHAEQLGALLAPGGPNHRWAVLAFADPGTEYARAARKYFQTMQANYRGLATVVTSPVVRAAINMMLRLGGGAREFRLFTGEAEALAWLDSLPA